MHTLSSVKFPFRLLAILCLFYPAAFAQQWEPLGPFDFPVMKVNDFMLKRTVGVGRAATIRFYGSGSMNIAVTTPYGGYYTSAKSDLNWKHEQISQAPVGGIADVLFYSSNGKDRFVLTGDPDCLIDKHSPALGSESCQSHGIYRSKDGGATYSGPIGNWYDASGNLIPDFWTFPSLKIARRLVRDPQSKNRFYLLFHTYSHKTDTYDGYIYCSDDAGKNWRPLLFEKDGYFRDIEFLPGDSRVIYVAGRSVFRSDDRGKEWKRLESLPSDPEVQRMEVAVSKLQSSWIWVMIMNPKTRLNEIYRSTDRGETFVKAGTTTKSPEWRSCMVVDHTSADRLHVSSGNKPAVIFYNGNSYKVEFVAQAIHDDLHDLTVDPVNGDLYASTDAGVYRSIDKGKNWVSINNGLNIAECWGISVAQKGPLKILAGLQDCGTILYRETDSVNNRWTIVRGGDGMDGAIDPADPTILYYNDGNNNIFARSDDGGEKWTKNFTIRNQPANYRRPFALNSQRPATVYTGYRQLFKSHLKGDSLYPISEKKEENIQAFSVAASDSNVICIAYSNPCWNEEIKEKLFLTRDGGVSWNDITAGLNGVKWWNISSVAIDPDDPASVYVGFQGGSPVKLMHSRDFGKTWRDITHNLPGAADVNCILIDSVADRIFIGTHTTIFEKSISVDKWTITGTGLPVVMVSDMDLRYDTYSLFAGTHGCGVWKIQLRQP